MKLRSLAPIALLLLAACGPSEADRTNMKDKMDLETQRAAIWSADIKSCSKLATDSKAFNQTNHDRHVRLAKWWDGVNKGAKGKLIAENQAVWDGQSNALVQTLMTCPNEIKASMKGE